MDDSKINKLNSAWRAMRGGCQSRGIRTAVLQFTVCSLPQTHTPLPPRSCHLCLSAGLPHGGFAQEEFGSIQETMASLLAAGAEAGLSVGRQD